MAQVRTASGGRADEFGAADRVQGHDVGLVAVGVAVALALQCLRVLFPIAYAYREASGIARTIFVLTAVFALPAFAPLFARVARPGTAFLSAAVGLGALRVVLQS